LLDNDDFVATTHFISDEKSPLWPYSDAVMHYECFLAWSLRSQFVVAYNETMRNVVDMKGFHLHMQDDGQVVWVDENGVIDRRTDEEVAADVNRYIDEMIAAQALKPISKND
jgi:hypothetical protein